LLTPSVACLISFGWIAGVGGAPSGVSSGTGIMRGCKAAQHRGAPEERTIHQQRGSSVNVSTKTPSAMHATSIE
jgi:hypothetical protein